ncbi:MAG: fibronectin type III domain-containing protein [Anaerolineales bacterium]|nr:fibronectin type III domain-containing protein [Chloroflexota bacterium]MBL6982477.1 fibronectin type III domain-containing protein [Anaerolineales bacterium]
MRCRLASNNSANEFGGGVYASSYSSFGESMVTMSGNTVNNNLVSTNGSGVYFSSSGVFHNNTVVGNAATPNADTAGGVSVDGTPQLTRNNIYGNLPYDFVLVSPDDVPGADNYWGAVSDLDILEGVYDWYDDSSRGKLLFVPYLDMLSSDAPFPPPTNVNADIEENSIILSWNAHPGFTDGWGYRVYYDTESPLPQYEGTGIVEGNSPIEFKNITTVTLSGIDPSKNYYFAVTTFNNLGQESWYSIIEAIFFKQEEYEPTLEPTFVPSSTPITETDTSLAMTDTSPLSETITPADDTGRGLPPICGAVPFAGIIGFVWVGRQARKRFKQES